MADKGRRMESLVEELLRLRGFAYERNVRVRGRSGSLHEIDFLARSSAGLVLYEVKNLERPAPKEVVVKAFEVARDVGAVRAVVVSASGFTEGAVRVARALGVELMDLESLLEAIEAARAVGVAVFLEPRHAPGEAAEAAGRLARRRLLLFRAERVDSVKCVYVPFYYFTGDIALGGGSYRRVDVAASGYTGLPLALVDRVLIDAAGEAARLPADLVPLYSSVAGRTVKSSEAAASMGQARWRRLLASLEAAGLAERVRRRPLTVRVADVRPPLGALEEAAATLAAAWGASAPASGCSVVHPAYSPGAVLSFLRSLYGVDAVESRVVYAPVYAARLVDKGDERVYRLVYLAGWTPRLLTYKPASDIRVAR